jgi:hypothetical protein
MTTTHPKGHFEKVAAASGFRLSDEELHRRCHAYEEDVRNFYSHAAAASRRRRVSAAPSASSPSRAPAIAIGTLPSLSPTRRTPVPAPSSVRAASRSRAAQVAKIHLGPINESRKRAGLGPLALAELAKEFADVDREPPRTKVNRRDAANMMAARQGVPMTQAAKLNATLAAGSARSSPTSAPGSSVSAPQSQAEIDEMHSANVAKLNATLPEHWRPKAGRAY